MKRISLLLLAAVALSMNACEPHKWSETKISIDEENGVKEKAEPAHAKEEAAPAEAPKPTAEAPKSAESKPADPANAPKFIPDSK